jgi:hypothetical protein
MFQKGFKFYSDWRTPDGKRHRKAFATAQAAKAHELQQRGKLAPMTPERSRAIAPGSRLRPVRSGTSQSASDESPKASKSTSSSPGTSRKPNKVSRATPAPPGTATPASSGNSSEESPQSAAWTSADVSRGSKRPNPGSTAQPKAKLAALSDALISHSDGSSPVASTSASDAEHRREAHSTSSRNRSGRHQHQTRPNRQTPDHTPDCSPRGTREGDRGRRGFEIRGSFERAPSDPRQPNAPGTVAEVEVASRAAARLEAT